MCVERAIFIVDQFSLNQINRFLVNSETVDLDRKGKKNQLVRFYYTFDVETWNIIKQLFDGEGKYSTKEGGNLHCGPL